MSSIVQGESSMYPRSAATVPPARRSSRRGSTAIIAAVFWGLSVASLAIGVLCAPSGGPNAPSLAAIVATGLAILSPVTVSAVLATVFVVVILTIQAALAQVTSSNTFAVAASTLVVAALFQPLRQRVQARVDRRFNRARYDAERTVAAFVGRLRDEVDLGQLDAEIMATVARTVQPTSVSLWLRGSGAK